MSVTLDALKRETVSRDATERARGLATPLNLHLAGAVVLTLLNLYLLAHMAFAWQAKRRNSADALDQQRMALRAAEIAAKPLQGLDTKLANATAESDDFYARRLPGSVSDVAAELGAVTKKEGVRLTRVSYTYAPILPGTTGELVEDRIDASLSGDYRPLVQVINGLERDRIFFVISGVTLTGQQSGTVGLRLRLTTYLRGNAELLMLPADTAAPATTAPATATPTAPVAGGPAQ